MSCKKFEGQIWLYSELQAEQKKVLASHLSTCPICQQLWNEAEALTVMTDRWKAAPQSPGNAAQLTHRIMTTIDSQSSQRKSGVPWIDVVNTVWLRCAMACVSVLIVISFFYVPSPTHSEVSSNYRSSPHDVYLKSAAFVENEVKDRGEAKSSFSLLACIQNRSCPHLFSQKKKKYHESL